MTLDPDAAQVKAAGGVVWRWGRKGVEYLLVHRPRYDDWTLPKGKLEHGESWEDAARREVEEETGVRSTMGPELGAITYTDNKGREKAVRYWLMEASGKDRFEPNDEVDEMCWLPAKPAAERLTYPRDREVLAEAHLAASMT